jgi:hypothetical protein
MKRRKERAEQTLEALNTIASRLSDYEHEWTKEERRMYGVAYRWLTSFCDGDSEA